MIVTPYLAIPPIPNPFDVAFRKIEDNKTWSASIGAEILQRTTFPLQPLKFRREFELSFEAHIVYLKQSKIWHISERFTQNLDIFTPLPFVFFVLCAFLVFLFHE